MTRTTRFVHLVRWLTCSAVALIGLASCGGVDTVEAAADTFDIPAAFAATDAETLNGFEETQRVLTFTTDLSQREACETGRAALEAWAGQTAPAASNALPLTWCSTQIRNPADHSDIDFASVRVERARIDGEFIADENQPGGVSRVIIFFAVDK